MKNLLLIITVLFLGSLFTSCMSSRFTTHWIVDNSSDKDVSLNVNVAKMGSTHGRTRVHTIKPGLQELGTETFAKGAYSVVASTNDVSKTNSLYLNSDTWVIISFTNQDSVIIHRRLGYVDMSSLKKINGKYTGIDMFNERRKPPILYSIVNRK